MTTARSGELDRATRNAAAFWTALARARGLELVRRTGFLAASGGRGGLRVLLLGPEPGPGDRAELTELVRRAPGRVVVEDPFSTTEVPDLAPRRYAVMTRGPAPVPPPAHPVRPVGRAELGTVEPLVVEGFPLPAFRPRTPGEAIPPALLDQPVEVLLAERDGVPAGACLVVLDTASAGLYWVTTLPEHRSRGVGRSLVAAALARHADRTATLTATEAGLPLYASLGFATAGVATWWFREP